MDHDGSVVYAEQPVVVCAVQQFVQLVQRPAGGVPWQEGRLLRQVANQLQGNALWEVPRPESGSGESQDGDQNFTGPQKDGSVLNTPE